MIYTVSDFLNSYEDRVRLLAGKGGLSRAIRQVGMLDYELMPGLKSRYQRVNFERDQLVLSTFLYARDDAWLIGEAVKYLVGRGCSGLVIKNVFHLEIPDSALRYAKARDFPLFVTTKDDFFFDLVIADVDQRALELSDASFAQNELDVMLHVAKTPEEVREHAFRLDPSLKEEHVAIYVADVLSQEGLAQAMSRYHASGLAGLNNMLTAFDGGLLYVASAESDVVKGPADLDHMVMLLRADVLDHEDSAAIGVSDVHYALSEMSHAVLEAERSAHIARRQGGGTVRYGDLGVIRALLPFADEPEMRLFAESVFEPLRDYDAQTGSALVETLEAYCDAGESVEAAARALGQHPNTVRYRLDKVAALTGLSYKNRPEMEQLSIACKIGLCQEVLRD